jgi:glutathione S-transferase
MHLHYIDGSPFARMLRVLIHEHRLDVAMTEIVEFPPSDDLFRLNPMGQVPVLTVAGQPWFPTRVALDRLLEAVDSKRPEVASAVCRPAHVARDDQTLAVILAMGDALALHHYLDWSGSGETERNRLGFTVKERAMVRVLTTLDWLEARLDPAGFQPGCMARPAEHQGSRCPAGRARQFPGHCAAAACAQVAGSSRAMVGGERLELPTLSV